MNQEDQIFDEAEKKGITNNPEAMQKLRDEYAKYGNYTRLPRLRANIKGARYSTKTHFKTREEAVQHILDNRIEYFDMFLPDDADGGRPSADRVLGN